MENFRNRYALLFALLFFVMGLRAHGATYTVDVEPIMQRHCQSCHRPNQIAPMSLLTYEQIRPWAKAIRARVANREMPPWHADPLVGEFVNDRSLSDAEIKTIVDWIDAGTPEGDRAAQDEPIKWPEGWSIGEPDLVLSMDRPYRVPAHGQDQFEYFSIDTNMTEDRFIRSVEVRPGDPRVVHHVLAYIHQNDNYDFRDEESFQDSIGRGGTILTEYALGNNGDIFPEGTGRLLKRGAKLFLEIHYHSYGESTTDQTQIALQFHPKGYKSQRIISRWIGTRNLQIPPNRKDIRSYGSYTFERPVYLISFQPHMHCRGQSMRATASYPDGRSEVIFNVPHFDFNWQTTYTYKAPMLLPAGTRIRIDAAHDNTRDNPNNPDSNQYVYWGLETTDEMMHMWTDFVYADEGFSAPVTDRGQRDDVGELVALASDTATEDQMAATDHALTVGPTAVAEPVSTQHFGTFRRNENRDAFQQDPQPASSGHRYQLIRWAAISAVGACLLAFVFIGLRRL